MKYYLYYITRIEFEKSFNTNLSNLIDFNPPVYTPLIFNNDIALYAYTNDKTIAKEFENTRNMNIFIKVKEKCICMGSDISCRKISIERLNTKRKIDNKLITIDIPIVESEFEFLNIEILSNITEELLYSGFTLENIGEAFNNKYKRALDILGFHELDYYDEPNIDLSYKLDQFSLFVRIYKNLLKK